MMSISNFYQKLEHYIQQFEFYKIAMSNQEQHNLDKNKNQNSEEEHIKMRPRSSLFPIRNSAQRKINFDQQPDIFNPHASRSREHSSLSKTKSESADSDHHISDTSFQYRSSDLNPSQKGSIPRTPKSAPKQFELDTPFVPFVHQSLTRTVWQTEQIIPEQRDEIDKKQSQNEQKLGLNIIPGSQNFGDEVVGRLSQEQQKKQSTINNQDEDSFLLEEINEKDKIAKPKPELSICNSFHFTVAQFIRNQNTLQVGGHIQHTQIPVSIPIQAKSQQTLSPYLSYSSFQTTISPKKKKLAPTDIMTISIAPYQIQKSCYEQQTEQRQNKIDNYLKLNLQRVPKQNFEVQTVARNLSIGNRIECGRLSARKQHVRQQTESLSEKFQIVSQSFNQKIGRLKKLKNTHQQTFSSKNLKTVTCQTQPQMKMAITHQKQMNLMICYDYQTLIEKKLNEFEELLKKISLEKQNKEIQTSQIGIQCDAKNLQNRTSLKRVSIADTKIVYHIDQSQSQSQSLKTINESGEKEQSKRKSKGKAKPKQVKLEHEQSFDLEQEIKLSHTYNSKKKRGKTPNKKSKKK